MKLKLFYVLAAGLTVGCGRLPIEPTTVITEPQRIVAFGDSLTEGKISDGTFTTAYPSIVEATLSVPVTNAGWGGERAAEARNRFSEVMATNPDTLLLLHGVNDVNVGNTSAGLEAIAEMVREAKQNGVTVYLATLPSFTEGGYRARGAGKVPGFNDQLRAIARTEGVTLVDIERSWRPELMGEDGIHPNAEGYRLIGQLFVDAIEGDR
jgi:lysophospholipase L1-like esterase